MVKLFTVDQMIALEKEANSSGLAYAEMMDNAGKGIAKEIHDHFHSFSDKNIFALVGAGNNGGDALVALSELISYGWKASAYIISNRNIDDPLIHRLAEKNGTIIFREKDPAFSALSGLMKTNRVVLDGVLGTGFKLPLKDDIAIVLSFIQKELHKQAEKLWVVAVDCPSGIDCNTGEVSPETISADLTITMAGLKSGLIKFPAANFVGELRYASIGKIDHLDTYKDNNTEILSDEIIKQYLPHRPKDSHKGTFGTAFVLAGSASFTGAALLAGKAAYRIGAGLVNMAVPNILHSTLAGQFPEATWILLPQENGFISSQAVLEVRNNLNRATAILIGPGFGLQNTTREFLQRLLVEIDISKEVQQRTIQGQNEILSKIPIVIDADGLKLLSKIKNWEKLLPPETILTPHPGEMAFLTELAVQEIQSNRIEIAQKYSAEWGHIVVLKGAYTVIAEPGGKIAIIPIATAALAKAGTGDVLAGLITGLRAQRVEAFPAACAGAWIHAQAGLKAASIIGNNTSVLASDVLNAVQEVISEL